ncbi:phytoene/squalene synthase family protein [Terasakiella pusilla]|uniref:phytoene/squalene synthase family protein n=1 Tax=Terasakiella pusilla TaxID=64973 RepID=UPI003AA9CCFA
MTQVLATDFKYVEDVVLQSKSSFALGMKALPADRRGYLFAIYAYCRILDDIADEAGTVDQKLVELARWRAKIDQMLMGKPECPVTRVLYEAVQRFPIPSDEFYKVIEGMEADVRGPIQRPEWDQLYAYCRCVAVSVGLLSLPIFGRTDKSAQQFAEELGYALQFTNILRDVAEDWSEDRFYLPYESLIKHGVKDINSPNLSNVLEEVANKAEQHYQAAERLIDQTGSKNLKPALLMMVVYKKLFEKMKQRGWSKIEPRIRLSTLEKAMTVSKLMAFG